MAKKKELLPLTEQQQQFIDAFEANGGFEYHACKEVGIIIRTVWQWRKDRKSAFDDVFDDVKHRTRGVMAERATMALIKQIDEGNMPAIKFALEKSDGFFRLPEMQKSKWDEKQEEYNDWDIDYD